MEAKRFNEVQKDVAANFATPGAILGDSDLEPGQKVKLLQQWEYDLRQMLVASEENMTDQTAAQGSSAELLRKVRKALSALEEAHPGLKEDQQGAAAKTGGAVN